MTPQLCPLGRALAFSPLSTVAVDVKLAVDPCGVTGESTGSLELKLGFELLVSVGRFLDVPPAVQPFLSSSLLCHNPRLHHTMKELCLPKAARRRRFPGNRRVSKHTFSAFS